MGLVDKVFVYSGVKIFDYELHGQEGGVVWLRLAPGCDRWINYNSGNAFKPGDIVELKGKFFSTQVKEMIVKDEEIRLEVPR